ncbi:hypothetical protein [Bosea sp. PAMC 26642]|uniref:hypothetical protein n=1 Tax=Bosea sp. (strain PAMC 26642) TaxID=1792307 RepID=UPI0007702287|nr:hypothetical protein [Bosea sp. PAMC 26642]AMJ60944.1 hypothetical protein AXW83_12135 [Bosea sp. PAMC 26642]
MIRRVLIAVATAIAFSPLTLANAQTIELGPNGLRVNPPEPIIEFPDRPPPRFEEEGISEFDAVRIARREGLERVERVRQGRRGWVVVGIDVNGDDMRVIIRRDGEVIDVQRE